MPPGKYQVKLTSVTINNAQSSGRLQASFECTILDTEHRGRKLFAHFGLDDVDQRGYLRGALAKLGVEWPGKPKELPSVLEQVQDTFAEVNHTLRKRKDKETGQVLENYNTYFNRALDSTDVDDLEEDTSDDDAKPTAAAGKKPAATTTKPARTSKPAAEPDEGEAEAEEEATNGEVVVQFKADGLDKTKKHKTRIKQLATKHDFDLEEYNDLADLIGDIAEHVGLSGKFDDPEALITAVESKGEEK